MTHRCIAFACQEEAHSGSNLCYKHLPTTIPEEEARERLALMKLELEALENYAKSLREEAEVLEQRTKEAFQEADKIKSIADHKANEVAKYERGIKNNEKM